MDSAAHRALRAASAPVPVPRPFQEPMRTTITLLMVVIALLSVAVQVTRTALPGDLGIAAAVQWLLPDTWLGHPLELLNVIGGHPYQTGVLAVLVALLLVRRRRCGALAPLLACSCADGTSFLMNRLIQQPRPQAPELVVDLHSATYVSVPSGHVVSCTVLCGLLRYLTDHPCATAGWWWPVHGFLLAWPLRMGVSRILTGEHWPSAVQGLSAVRGGSLVAAFWLVGSLPVYPWTVARWPRLVGQGNKEPMRGGVRSSQRPSPARRGGALRRPSTGRP